MVNRRRPLKFGTALSKQEALSGPPPCLHSTLKPILNNPSIIREELALLDLESSFISSSKLPVLTVDAFQIQSNQHTVPSVPTISKGSSVCLPRFGSVNKSDNDIQHYVYIPQKRPFKSARQIPQMEPIFPERTDAEIALEAKREATVLQQINKLSKQGLWSASRLPKIMEPKRRKSHWDYLLDEARWMFVDFAEERKWKLSMAKRIAHDARMYCLLKEELERRDQEALEDMRRKGAAQIAVMIRDWWVGVSDTVDTLSILSNRRQWCIAQRRNRDFVAQHTDLGANWMSLAINQYRIPKPTLQPPTIISDIGTDDQDIEWLPPTTVQSCESSTMSSSFESLVDLESSSNSSLDNWTKFSWGLQSHLHTTEPLSPSQFPESYNTDTDRMSTDSSLSSSQATDKEDVVGLISDGNLPLNVVLEPYMSNGWSPLAKVIESGDQIPMEREENTSAMYKPSPYQSFVNTLRHEAALPLRQILPAGYQPLSTTFNGMESPPFRRRLSVRRSNRPVIVNGGSPVHANYEETDGVCVEKYDEDDDESVCPRVDSTLPINTITEEDRECLSDSEASVASSATHFGELLSPGELARRARKIASWKLFDTPKGVFQTQLPAFGPTCRVPFLPTQTLYAAVSWLNAGYAQRTPACLVTPAPPSSEAELSLAIHMGQLAVRGGDVGDWGPHLVVCPRVLVSAWRCRLASVCPGLRVVCVVSGSSGGTGRRLRRGVAQGRINICLTTYAALKSRPSRFARIRWSVVILDQAQYLLTSYHQQTFEISQNPSDQGSVQSELTVAPSSADPMCTSSLSGLRGGTNMPETVILLIKGILQAVQQRICIFAEDISTAHTSQLKSLFGLLTCTLNVEDGIKDASLIKPEPNTLVTRSEVIGALEPFIYRFEEDEDSECFFKEEIVSNFFVKQQRDLHDRVLMDKTCERAVKSGHLSDLLTSVSAGARVCVHPWLLCSAAEVQLAAAWLAEDHGPSPSPLIAPVLRFNTPESLLLAIRTRCDEIYTPPLLLTSLEASAYVRRRLVELLPDAKQLRAVLEGQESPSSRRQQPRHCSSPVSGKKARQEASFHVDVHCESAIGLPFIGQELFDSIILEESAKLATRAAVHERPNSSGQLNTPKPSPATSFVQILAKPRQWDHQPEHLASSHLIKKPVIDVDTRIGQLERQSQLIRLTLLGFADWCSIATSNFIRSASRVPSLIPYDCSSFSIIPSTRLSSLYSVVRDHYELLLPLFSSPFTILCTRDKAIAMPQRLKDQRELHPPCIGGTFQQVYPLSPSARWCSPHSHSRHLPHFLAASGKIQRLRGLLRDLVQSKSNQLKKSDAPRPRVIFILSHQLAFLDLLESWLPGDPYLSSLTCLRFPMDHLEPGHEDVAVEKVNAWPRGCQGPLLALMHARSPSLALAGLRAGQDTRVIICDADWRTDVVDNLKLKLHCWSVNGLVDSPPNNFHSILPLRVFRLVTEAKTKDSVEARLVISPAVRLLPDSVFITSSPASASAVDPIDCPPPPPPTPRRRIHPNSRVQPNVVRELVSCLRRRALWRKQGGGSIGSPSFPPSESDFEETTADEESDTASLFHNREPLDEALLHQAFELHESPRDVQVWCSSLAEFASISTEIHGDQTLETTPVPPVDMDLLPHNPLGELDVMLGHGNQEQAASLETWELNRTDWSECFETLEALTSDGADSLFYIPHKSASSEALFDDADGQYLPLVHALDLPIWSPLCLDEFTPSSCDGPLIDTSCVWGYALEPMYESELPPLVPSALHLKTTSPKGATTMRSLDPVTSAGHVSSATGFSLKRPSSMLSTARGAGVAGGGVPSVAGCPATKKRKLTGAAALAARRAANAKAATAAMGVSTFSSEAANSQDLTSYPPVTSGPAASNAPGGVLAPTFTSTTTTTLTVVLSSSTQKMSIPRPFYTRDLRAIAGVVATATQSTGFQPVARIRRVTAASRSGAGGMAALNSPLVLAKYAATTHLGKPAVQRQGLHSSSSGLVSFRFGGTSTSLGHLQSVGCLNEGKPPDWTLFEEAALFQCTLKIQNIPLITGTSSPSTPNNNACNNQVTPNFRLAEYFVNKFFPSLSYRSSRQCLLAYYRSLSTISASSSFESSSGGVVGATGTSFNNDESRRVKNKLKSSLSSSVLPPVSANLPGFNLSADSNASSSPHRSNQHKGYQLYQYLQSLRQSAERGHRGNLLNMPMPGFIGSLYLDSQIISVLRKSLRSAIATRPPASGHPQHLRLPHAQLHRVGFGGPTIVGGSAGGTPATTAALLMRSNTVSPVTGLPPSGATVIHKNPSHIAALQEHNINPDTLVTPAMVIKNKEERETRQRAEAAAAAAAVATPISVAVSAAAVASSSVSGVAGASVVASATPTASTITRVHASPVNGQPHHHSAILTSSGGCFVSNALPRSATGLLPFSVAGFSGLSTGSSPSGAPTVFRYTTPTGNLSVSTLGTTTTGTRQVTASNTPSTGILRRVGSVTSQLQNAPTLVRRGVTLSTGGGTTSQTSGVTVLTATRPGSVVYQATGGPSSVSSSPGITLVPAGTQGLSQIIHSRQPLRNSTSFPSQRFVRTFSSTPATLGVTNLSAAPSAPSMIHHPHHRQRKDPQPTTSFFTSSQRLPRGPSTSHSVDFSQRTGAVISDPQLLSRIHSAAAAAAARTATGATQMVVPRRSTPVSKPQQQQQQQQQQQPKK